MWGKSLKLIWGGLRAGWGKQIGAAAEAARAKADVTPLRDLLSEIYSEEQFKTELSVMDDNQIIEQANILSRGVPMGTPVFDGAREADVLALLEKAGLSNTGQERLTNGR